jgi:hypothetical protein
MSKQLIGIEPTEYLTFLDLILSISFWKIICFIWVPSLIVMITLILIIIKSNSEE